MDTNLNGATEIVPQDYTILVVDDNVLNLRLLMDYLVDYGFNVLVASSGDMALKRAKYSLPDMILLDVMMPGLDGFQTCRELKVIESTKDIPVIFMTALSDTKDKVKGFSAGAVDYVTKPLHEEEVIARINTHLSLRKMTRDLAQHNRVLSKQTTQLEISNLVGRQIISILDLDELIERVVNLIQTKFAYYYVGLWFWDKQMRSAVLEAGAGYNGSKPFPMGETLTVSDVPSIILHVCSTRRLYLAADVTQDPYFKARTELPHVQSELVIPLQIKSQFIGVLQINSDRVDDFSQSDLTVMQTLADQIAVAIQNAQLYQLAEQHASELKRLNTDKDKFLSILAHDLKGPFIPIVGSAELLSSMADRLDTAQITNLANSIHRSTQRVLRLLEDLLEWVRMQTGHMERLPTEFDMAELAQQNLELVQPKALEKAINVQSMIQSPCLVYADKRMVDTVLRNLLNNAVKFTHANGTISVSADVHATDSQFLRVAVSDTGVGIAADDLAKLFRIDAYHSTPGTAEETGTGLGLIMCQEMITLNGGQIWAESELEQGSVFYFTVPINAAAMPEAPTTASPSNQIIRRAPNSEWARKALIELDQVAPSEA